MTATTSASAVQRLISESVECEKVRNKDCLTIPINRSRRGEVDDVLTLALDLRNRKGYFLSFFVGGGESTSTNKQILENMRCVESNMVC